MKLSYQKQWNGKNNFFIPNLRSRILKSAIFEVTCLLSKVKEEKEWIGKESSGALTWGADSTNNI